MCLYALTGLSEGIAADELLPWLDDSGVGTELLSQERELFSRGLTQVDINILSWKSESMATLAWAGHVLDGHLEQPANLTAWNRFFPRIPPAIKPLTFVRDFRLRRREEIAIQIDVHYLIHAALRHPEDWQQHKQPVPSEFNICVVEQRRTALEWLADPDTPWSEITLDT